MPLMHSENKEDQKLSIEKFATLGRDQLHYAQLHQNIIVKFGRFPHRNLLLERKSTKEELEFLKTPHSSF